MLDKKGAMAAIMMKRSALGPNMPKVSEGPDEKASDGMDSLELTAKQAIDAIHAKDHVAFSGAMKDFYDLHSAKRNESDVPKGPQDSGN